QTKTEEVSESSSRAPSRQNVRNPNERRTEVTINVTEKDLRRIGLCVSPQDPSQLVPLDPDRDLQPDDGWSTDRLAEYVHAKLDEARHVDNMAQQLAKRSSVQVFRAGHALSIVRDRLKVSRAWERWLKEHGIRKTSAWEAIELCRRAQTEEAVKILTITEC